MSILILTTDCRYSHLRNVTYVLLLYVSEVGLGPCCRFKICENKTMLQSV
jgi:hypothetical protein